MNRVTGAVLGGRLRLHRQLGAGAFGTVYEAVDSKFGGRVAVKILTRDQPKAIYRFKREFRSLAEVIHPNLVRLYELVADDDLLYFTMELVEGRDFHSYLAGDGTVHPPTLTTEFPTQRAARGSRTPVTDVTRLRASFVQLARGVQAIHDAHKLHCDLKPSNVHIADDGRVVIFDFGLVADLDGDDRFRGAMGTPGYIAPEQLRGDELSRAADWYSVGVMLHEALTGRLPSAGEQQVASGELADLSTLASELINLDPLRRPSGEDVLRRLGEQAGTRSAQPITRLFGRATEMQALRSAWSALDTGPVLARIVGASGMGKTSLVDALLEEVAGSSLVLRGRCYEQESVPFKALDTVVDALAEYLRTLGSTIEYLPQHSDLLGRLFPVLRDTLRTTESSEQVDSVELRRRAFLALRDLFAHIARIRPVVIFLDDLQWGDVDSARLLVEILRPPNAPRMLVIAAHRPDATSAFLSTFNETALPIEQVEITVSELDSNDARALAEHLLETKSPEFVASIGQESSGNPLFIQQLAASANERGPRNIGELGIGDVILARIGSLGEAARKLVETVALAGQPIEETIAVRASALGITSRDATLEVRHARLVSARTTPNGIVLEPAHDRVRETLVASLPADIAKRGHLQIAEALIELSQPDPERLVHHFRSAGDDGRTRTYAVLAADRADEALAFDRAATHRHLILELSPPTGVERSNLLEQYALSLANAGRAIEAADAYERAADQAAPTRVLGLRQRSGELTLRSGRLELGSQRMQRVLTHVGVKVPASRAKATWLSIARRSRLFVRGIEPKGPVVVPSVSRTRLDALWSACTGITMANHVLGDALSLQHLLEALEVGSRSDVVRGLGIEATFNAVIGGGYFRRRLSRIHDAMESMAKESGEPFDRAWTHHSRGCCGWFFGDWNTCVKECGEAIRVYRESCRGVSWEIAIAEAYLLPGLAYTGELSQLSTIVARAYRDAKDRGDLFAANTLRLGQQSLTALVEDRPADAIDEANAAISPFPRDTYLGPHYHHLFAISQAELYRNQPDAAWTAITNAWGDIEKAKLLSVQCLRIEIRQLRARAAIAAAVGRTRSTKLLDVARSDAKRIASDKLPIAAPMSALLRAGIACVERDRATAERLLSDAVAGFAATKMQLYRHAAADRLGKLIGGSEGSQLQAASSEWFASHHVRNPSAMIGMLAPGC